MNDEPENHNPEGGNENSAHSGSPAHVMSWPYGHRGDRPHDPNGNQTDGDVGVADYYSRKPKRSTSTLVALAPHVLLLARCEGAPETAKYFSERLGVNVTEKMVKTLKSKVARGLLVVTREELEAAARSHPITAARMIREPAICDPQHYRAAITPETDHETEAEEKKASVKKAAAKKAAARKVETKKAGEKKATESKTPATTPTGLQQPKSGTAPTIRNPEAPKGMKQIVSDEEAEENDRLLEEAARRLRGG